MVNTTVCNSGVLTQFVGESLWDFFVRQGKNPLKFGITKPVQVVKKKTIAKKAPAVRRAIAITNTVDSDVNVFIKAFYNDFENLLSTYNAATVKIFLMSLISYMNDGKISRRNIYDFVINFDKEDKIRQMTWDSFNYEVKFEDWHHVGGAFSHLISKMCAKSDNTESNGIDGKLCTIFLVPAVLITYVKDVIDIHASDGMIMLDHSYNNIEIL